MYRKILSCLFTLGLLVTFTVGCGGKAKDEVNAAGASTEEAVGDVAEDVEAGADEAADEAGEAVEEAGDEVDEATDELEDATGE